MTAQKLGVR